MTRGEQAEREHHKKRLEALRTKTGKKVQYHLSKAFIDSEDFYHLVTEFFLELLEKHYAATYEDILRELEQIEHEHILFTKRQREKAASLLRVLSQIEYQQGEVPQDTAKLILQDFASLADEFTRLEEDTIERALREGFRAAQQHKLDGARKAYQKAHALYDHLGEQDKEIYFPELQKLFSQVNPKKH